MNERFETGYSIIVYDFLLCVLLEGKVPHPVSPFLLGASLTVSGGGIRAIAVVCTLRRLAAEVAGGRVKSDAVKLLMPHQLGYGVRLGAEAAAHAA